jgi:hypothetical protein
MPFQKDFRVVHEVESTSHNDAHLQNEAEHARGAWQMTGDRLPVMFDLQARAAAHV